MAVAFTKRATQVLAQAEQEARRFNHDYVGGEHILLALIQVDSGVATCVLRKLGIDERMLRFVIERILGPVPSASKVDTCILPRTPRAKSGIQYAADEAGNQNKNSIGSGHLLLGLLREKDGAAAQILTHLGAELKALRAEVYRHGPVPLCWQTSDVVAIAKGITEDTAFDRMPILADALQDAGCDDPEILDHLRLGTAHGCNGNGCWAVDRLLIADQADERDDVGQSRRWWRFWFR